MAASDSNDGDSGKKDSWGNQAGWATMKKRGGAYGQGNGWDNIKREYNSIFGSDPAQASNGDSSDDSGSQKDAMADALKKKMAGYQGSN